METIGEVIRFLVQDKQASSTIAWPPDAFAICGILLERSGAYLWVIRKWPPGATREDWVKTMAQTGKRWREMAARPKESYRSPKLVADAWRRVLAVKNSSMDILRDEVDGSPGAIARESLLTIFTAADEACVGAGIPNGLDEEEFGGKNRAPTQKKIHPLENKFLEMLFGQREKGVPSTLCRRVPPTKLSVLPKLHTPPNGHYAALTLASSGHMRDARGEAWVDVDGPSADS